MNISDVNPFGWLQWGNRMDESPETGFLPGHISDRLHQGAMAQLQSAKNIADIRAFYEPPSMRNRKLCPKCLCEIEKEEDNGN